MSHLDSHDDYERKLLPESMSLAMKRVSVLLVGWELVKADVVEGVRGFFVNGFDEEGETLSDDYGRKVLSRSSGKGGLFIASAGWLVDTEALISTDLNTLTELRLHRNEVAHEIVNFLLDPAREVRIDLLYEAKAVIDKLGRFWGSISVDCDPRFDDKDVDYDAIRSGASLFFEYILGMADLQEEP